MRTWTIILGVLIVSGALMLTVRSRPQTPGPLPGEMPALRSVSYSRGGGMDGGNYELSLQVDDSGTVTVEEIRQEYWNSEEKTRKKTVDAACCREIEEIVRSSGMLGWGNLPLSPIQVLDAATYSLNLYFEGGSSVNIREIEELPEGGDEAVREILSSIKAAAGWE